MYADAIVLTKMFSYMCLLKRQPQDIPASRELLTLTVGIYLLLNLLLAALDKTVTNTLLAGLVDTAFLLVFVYLLLLLCRKANRWSQTVTALAGTGILFGVLLIPLVLTLPDSNPMTSMEQIFYLLLYVIIIWYVVVMAHIFRHAISSSFVVGVFVSITYMLIGVLIEFTFLYPVQ